MAFTHIFTATIEPLSFFDGGGSTDSIDTRGCDLIVFIISADANSGPFASDNQGNHYFHNLNAATAPGNFKNVMAYSVGPTDDFTAPLVTSANHVFTLGGGTYAQSCIIYGFSGVDASDPLDISGVGQSKDTSTTPLALYIDADTVAPSLDGNLIISGCTFGNSQAVFANVPVDNDVRTYSFSAGVHYGNAAAWYAPDPAATVTPQWDDLLIPGWLAATVTVFNGGTPSPPVPGGSGDVDGWFDTSRWIRKPI